MKIYTKTGDKGNTSLYGGKRVPKYNTRIEAYGTVDELNSFLGLLRDQNINDLHKEFLINIQNDLFTIGAILATPTDNEKAKKLNIEQITPADIKKLELEIDALNISLDPMTHFILPGGHQTVSYCHVCRSICRRTERLAFKLADETHINNDVLIYLNRLSDYLFVLARKLTKDLKINETKWIPSKH